MLSCDGIPRLQRSKPSCFQSGVCDEIECLEAILDMAVVKLLHRIVVRPELNEAELLASLSNTHRDTRDRFLEDNSSLLNDTT